MKTSVFKSQNFFVIQNRRTLICFFFFLVSYCMVTAQVIWQAPAGQSWLVIGNWAGNAVPSATDIAQFGIAPTSGVTGVGINMNNPTNNGIANQAVGAIELTNARTANLKLGNSSSLASGILTLNGAVVNGISDVVIRNNAAGAFTIDNTQSFGTNTMSVDLNDAAENKIYIDNSGGITINTVIKGAGRKLSLYGAGSGVLQLNATNEYTGITTVNACTLQLNKAGGNTLPASNDIVVNGGALRVSADQTLHDLTLAAGASIAIDAGVTLAINGTFFCNGGTINGTGTIVYGTGATVSYGATVSQVTTAAEFPAVSGPANVVINNPSGVSLHATRSISGIITLAGGNFILGANDFTSAGTNGAATASTHVVTDGAGKLFITHIGTGNVFFPVGANTGSINPVIISNGNDADYGVRVVTGFASAIADASRAVNRTWIIGSLTTPSATVNVSFLYSAGDGNSAFNYSAPVDHGIYLPFGFGWNVNQSGLPQLGAYRVNTQVSSFFAGTELPMVLGNLGAILHLRPPVVLLGREQEHKAELSWNLIASLKIVAMSMERSADSVHFSTLAKLDLSATHYEDAYLLSGANYYRIKMTTATGDVIYSNIVTVFNSSNAFTQVNFSTPLVKSSIWVNAVCPKNTAVNIAVTNMAGQQLLQKKCIFITGKNPVEINVSGLAPGIYLLTVYAADGTVTSTRFIKQ